MGTLDKPCHGYTSVGEIYDQILNGLSCNKCRNILNNKECFITYTF